MSDGGHEGPFERGIVKHHRDLVYSTQDEEHPDAQIQANVGRKRKQTWFISSVEGSRCSSDALMLQAMKAWRRSHAAWSLVHAPWWGTGVLPGR